MPGADSSQRWASTDAAIPIGRLTKKIQCQLIAWVSRPPANSPIDPPAAAAKLKTPIAWLGKRGDDHSENQRRRHLAADTLDEPSGDQELLIARHTAQQRSCGENHQPRNKDAFAAKQVAEAAGKEQQATERNQVRVDDPGQPRL